MTKAELCSTGRFREAFNCYKVLIFYCCYGVASLTVGDALCITGYLAFGSIYGDSICVAHNDTYIAGFDNNLLVTAEIC